MSTNNDTITHRITTAHEYTKHDLRLNIDMIVNEANAAAIDEITDAYHNLIRTITMFATDFDTLDAAISDTRRQHINIQGPF